MTYTERAPSTSPPLLVRTCSFCVVLGTALNNLLLHRGIGTRSNLSPHRIVSFSIARLFAVRGYVFRSHPPGGRPEVSGKIYSNKRNSVGMNLFVQLPISTA